ncbi:phosphoribosyl-ATP diphosphatase, partial [Candidatus Fermentibacterales bacterium]|nr:phosphoribosyl-ATP diphosphatase [Candidatus Fermentibacterales bacterium]
ELGRFGEIAVIDLDAALGEGENRDLVRSICRVADVRAGGGIRSEQHARELLRAGARRVIIGTCARESFVRRLPRECVQVALDHDAGEVLDLGWRRRTGETLEERLRQVEGSAGSLLCTFVADEGGMRGINLDEAGRIAGLTSLSVTFAGGIRHESEIAGLAAMGADAQVGMSLYSGRLDPAEAVVECLDFERTCPMPTIVMDRDGQVLMLAYSTRESLLEALRSGSGVYYSRSRRMLWRKGSTSGCTQRLLRVRADCDRDALLFTVDQSGSACHTGSYSCFGSRKFGIPLLMETLSERMASGATGSLTARLGSDPALLRSKILEEAGEVVEASSGGELVWEIADLLYFLSVLASREGVAWRDVTSELAGRRRP